MGYGKITGNKIVDSLKWLHIPTGKLLAVTASEPI